MWLLWWLNGEQVDGWTNRETAKLCWIFFFFFKLIALMFEIAMSHSICIMHVLNGHCFQHSTCFSVHLFRRVKYTTCVGYVFNFHTQTQIIAKVCVMLQVHRHSFEWIYCIFFFELSQRRFFTHCNILIE